MYSFNMKSQIFKISEITSPAVFIVSKMIPIIHGGDDLYFSDCSFLYDIILEY